MAEEQTGADRPADAPASDRMVVVGRIGSTFGVHGWLKVNSYTEPPANILDYQTWQLGRAGRWQAVRVEEGRVTGKGVLAKLEGIQSPEDARIHVGAEVGIPRSALPPAAPGEYYWSDLEGLSALDQDGRLLGRVDHFRTTPAGAVVVISGEREHWIPFVKERIVSVDLDAGRIVLDWDADW